MMRAVREQRLALQGGWIARGLRQWHRLSDMRGGLHGRGEREWARRVKKLSGRVGHGSECIQWPPP